MFNRKKNKILEQGRAIQNLGIELLDLEAKLKNAQRYAAEIKEDLEADLRAMNKINENGANQINQIEDWHRSFPLHEK